ncbi:MAG: hypothetical protein ISS01_01185 [Nanoarchaeota archaeon]|nr:hypothetical protein [Nanoarchaeota archaeon]
MGLRTLIFGLSVDASHREIKSEIDNLTNGINNFEVKLRTKFKSSGRNFRNGFIKKKLKIKFSKRIKKLNYILEKQGIVGSEMGKRLGNDYARKIVKLKKIF